MNDQFAKDLSVKEMMQQSMGMGMEMQFQLQRIDLCYAMAQVKVFHDAADIVTPFEPTWPNIERVRLRLSLMAEESKETLDGHFGRTVEGQKDPGMSILDGCLDTIVVVAGTMLELGIILPLEAPEILTDPAVYPNPYKVGDAYQIYGLAYTLCNVMYDDYLNSSFTKLKSSTVSRIKHFALHTVKACVDIIEDLQVCPKTAFDIVCAANNRKIASDGKCVKRADGKILKPEGWYGPEAELKVLLDKAVFASTVRG